MFCQNRVLGVTLGIGDVTGSCFKERGSNGLVRQASDIISDVIIGVKVVQREELLERINRY
ncbi:hypothetical protein DPMN_080548 [Dreissena polymorpha]|uniref:Uncharacterized protein n=1 Tax=Dreissena polymorpha TaxID=45954 RepID=A0A9D3YU22_DREPO|nr:hypothetical protein DPMN_080548 [Dreissena polymorpha]